MAGGGDRDRRRGGSGAAQGRARVHGVGGATRMGSIDEENALTDSRRAGVSVRAAQGLRSRTSLDQRKNPSASAILNDTRESGGGGVTACRQSCGGSVGVFHRSCPGQGTDAVAEAVKFQEGT